MLRRHQSMRFTVSFLLLANCFAAGQTFSMSSSSTSNSISAGGASTAVKRRAPWAHRPQAAAGNAQNVPATNKPAGTDQRVPPLRQMSTTASLSDASSDSSDDSPQETTTQKQLAAGARTGTLHDSLRIVAGAAPGLAILAVACYALTSFLAPVTNPTAMGFKLVYAGAIAGIISRTLCAPIEMVSTVMMCRGDECVSMRDELNRTWKAEGLKGMFKGNGANCLKVAPSRGTQFLVYEFVKKVLVSRNLGMDLAKNSLHAGSRLFAGGVAGMVAAMIVYPLEVVKTMLTLYPEECQSIPGAIQKVFRTSGVGGLYRGLGPTLVAMFPYVGVEFMVYETLKKRWESSFGPASTLALLLLGALGGAAAQASAHPLDVIRRRMQMQSMNKSKAKGGKDDVKEGDAVKPYSNMFSGLYRVAKTEGWHVLFNGLGPACLEKIPSTAFGYYIYEGMKVALGVASV